MNSKAFLLLLFFLFLFVTLANGAVSTSDLTPDTTSVPGSLLQPTVVEGVSTGLCASPYTILAGDTLSGIAGRCGVVLEDLLAANPSITDPNLIRADQDLILPAPRIEPTTAPLQDPTATFTSAPSAPDIPTGTPVPDSQQSTTLVVAPNTTYHVDIPNLPPNAGVFLIYGPATKPNAGQAELTTDAAGHLITDITIPADAAPGETWTVLVMVKDNPDIEVTTTPFQIGNP